MDVNGFGFGRNYPFSIDSLMSEHVNEYMPQMMPMGQRSLAPVDCCYDWTSMNSNCFQSNTMKDMEGKFGLLFERLGCKHWFPRCCNFLFETIVNVSFKDFLRSGRTIDFFTLNIFHPIYFSILYLYEKSFCY